MKSVNSLVKDRKKGKTTNSQSSKSSSSSSGSGSSGSKSQKSKGGSDVIELTELNFNALVMESNDHWLGKVLIRYLILLLSNPSFFIYNS